jgi:hypothetical protein
MQAEGMWMRKVYFLRQNEDDGAVLDALAAAGIDPDDLSNPTCPRCGAMAAAGYDDDDDDFILIHWHISDKGLLTLDAKEDADWHLVCTDVNCLWEERVERSTTPLGAEIIDGEAADRHLYDRYHILMSHPSDLRRFADAMDEVVERVPTRLRKWLLYEADWREDDEMERRRKWANRVPSGLTVRLKAGDQKVQGRFLLATDEAVLVRTEAADELVAINLADLDDYRPRRLNPPAPLSRPAEEIVRNLKPEDLVWDDGSLTHHVRVRGFDLHLEMPDHLGRLLVSTLDPVAGAVLGLTEEHPNYWSGSVRKSEAEAIWFEWVTVKVRGFWVDQGGKGGKGIHVIARDPATAAALGLKPDTPFVPDWDEDDMPIESTDREPSWSGYVSPEEIEETSVRLEFELGGPVTPK